MMTMMIMHGAHIYLGLHHLLVALDDMHFLG